MVQPGKRKVDQKVAEGDEQDEDLFGEMEEDSDDGDDSGDDENDDDSSGEGDDESRWAEPPILCSKVWQLQPAKGGGVMEEKKSKKGM